MQGSLTRGYAAILMRLRRNACDRSRIGAPEAVVPGEERQRQNKHARRRVYEYSRFHECPAEKHWDSGQS
jgi:hypothetical protein